MNIEILTPEGQIYTGEGDSVQLPGVDGRFEVLNNHAPLIAALASGSLRIKNGSDQTTFEVKGGFVEVLRNQVSVLVEGAEAA
jgi:F-type H+-transporting ATPase subunit epsilon